jgi:2,4-dienoyl-CoA reductase-like NADH-dependent reductase (Old Yellow Enzyme family)
MFINRLGKASAAQIKKNVSIPVIAVNNIKRPEVAEELLQEGVL